MPGVFAVACFCNQNMGRSTSGPRRECRLDGSFQPDPYLPICSFLLSLSESVLFRPQCLMVVLPRLSWMESTYKFVWAYWSNQSRLLGGKATTRHFEKDPGSSCDGICISQQFDFFEDNGAATTGQSRHGSSVLLNTLSAMDGQIRRQTVKEKTIFIVREDADM